MGSLARRVGGEICVLLPGINEKTEKSEKFLKKVKKF